MGSGLTSHSTATAQPQICDVVFVGNGFNARMLNDGIPRGLCHANFWLRYFYFRGMIRLSSLIVSAHDHFSDHCPNGCSSLFSNLLSSER